MRAEVLHMTTRRVPSRPHTEARAPMAPMAPSFQPSTFADLIVPIATHVPPKPVSTWPPPTARALHARTLSPMWGRGGLGRGRGLFNTKTLPQPPTPSPSANDPSQPPQGGFLASPSPGRGNRPLLRGLRASKTPKALQTYKILKIGFKTPSLGSPSPNPPQTRPKPRSQPRL